MKNIILIISLLLETSLLLGQVQDTSILNKTIETQNRCFVYTYSGNLFAGDSINLLKEKDLSYIIIDSIEVELSHIQFLKFGNSVYANTKNLTRNNKNLFALRTYQGNLNLYTRVELTESNDYHNLFMAGDWLVGDYTIGTVEHNFNYFSKNYEELKLIKYGNLPSDISNKPYCNELLKKAVKTKNASVSLYIAGALTIAYGLIRAVSNDSKNESYKTIIPIGIGVSSIWIGTILSKRNNKLLQEAIVNY